MARIFKNIKITTFYNSTSENMLRAIDSDSVADINTYYFGPFVHEGTDGGSSSLKYILTSEGRILNKGTDTSPIWDWEYYLKDHLGNVRVVIAPTGEAGYSAVQQETHYYPYGMRISQLSNSANSTNKYLFSGKLLDDDFGLNWYDLHWRNYDPALCRFNTIDPMSEKHYNYTGYAYVYNNPLRFIDFMGLDSLDAIALTESAENAVDEITDEYGSSSAQCNRGVATAFEDLTGSNEFDDMTANEMYDHMESSDDFEQVEQSDLQEEANDGTIVIGAKQETGSGHIVMGVPGKEEYSGTWQENVPQVMDTGKDRRKSQTKISNSWGSSSKNNITYFRYKGETYTSRTYHGSKINNVTIRTKGIKYLQPLPVTIKY